LAQAILAPLIFRGKCFCTIFEYTKHRPGTRSMAQSMNKSLSLPQISLAPNLSSPQRSALPAPALSGRGGAHQPLPKAKQKVQAPGAACRVRQNSLTVPVVSRKSFTGSRTPTIGSECSTALSRPNSPPESGALLPVSPLCVLECDIEKLAREYHLEVMEVRSIVKAHHKASKFIDTKNNGMSFEAFKQFLVEALGTQDLDAPIFFEAYRASKARLGPFDMRGFLSWYQLNLFNLAKMVASPKHKTSSELVDRVATKFCLRREDVDGLKARFDQFDLDKSGEIESREFEQMMKIILGMADEKLIPGDRLHRFWTEVDRNASGGVDFEEFVQWYVKYFSDGKNSPVEAYYSSFNPINLRRKSLAAHRHSI